MKMKKPDKEQVYTLQQSEKIRGMLKSIKVSGTSFYIALGFEVALVIITRFLRAKEFFGIESLLYVMLALKKYLPLYPHRQILALHLEF